MSFAFRPARRADVFVHFHGTAKRAPVQSSGGALSFGADNQLLAANFGGARKERYDKLASDAPEVRPEGPEKHRAGCTNRRKTRHASRIARASPSPPLSLAHGPRKHTLRSDSRTMGPRGSIKARPRAPSVAAEQRTVKGRYTYISSHCSVRLMEPMRGFPAFFKSLSVFLLGKIQKGWENKENRGKHPLLQYPAQEILKPKGPCWTETMSPPINKN